MVNNVMSVQYGMIVLARFDVPTGTYRGIQFHKGMGYDFALTMDQVKKGGTEAHKQLLSMVEKLLPLYKTQNIDVAGINNPMGIPPSTGAGTVEG